MKDAPFTAREPVITKTAINTLVSTIIGIVAVQWPAVDAYEPSILTLVGVLYVIVTTYQVRKGVVSPASAAEAVVAAKQTPPETPAIPDIAVTGYRSAVMKQLPELGQRTVRWQPK